MEKMDAFEKRIKENIKNYAVKNLYPSGYLKECINAIAEELNVEILLTERSGDRCVSVGDFETFTADMSKKAEEEICIEDRVIGYFYTRYDMVPEEKKALAERTVGTFKKTLELFGTELYRNREANLYIEELEKKLKGKAEYGPYKVKEDILTGVFSKSYLENRINVLDRAEIAPVAVLNININDCKFVLDSFGVEKSDSLIQLVASILMKESKSEYIIGRVDGDAFVVLIPLSEDGEAENYASRIQEACEACDDSILAPSIAVGIAYKTNVEESIREKISDAEYEMFNNKLEIKSRPGYQERLRRGL